MIILQVIFHFIFELDIILIIFSTFNLVPITVGIW